MDIGQLAEWRQLAQQNISASHQELGILAKASYPPHVDVDVAAISAARTAEAAWIIAALLIEDAFEKAVERIE